MSLLVGVGSSIEDVNLFAYLAAFGGGVVSFLSPCVLPLVPVYLSVVTGLDLATIEDGAPAQRKQIVRTTSLFVLGFGAVFVSLGLTASALGNTLIRNQEIITRLSGTVLVMMALYLLGSLFLRAPWLYQEKRFHPQLGRFGDAAPVVAGVAFGFGWSPCIGPVLGSIFGIAASQDRIWAGATLLAAYTLGLGLPFLVVGLALGRLGGAFAWVKAHYAWIIGFSAAVMLFFGIYLMLDSMHLITSWLQNLVEDTPFEWIIELG